MINKKDIVLATTKILYDNFGIDNFTEDSVGAFEGECFYITAIPNTSQVFTKESNEKSLILSVKYFGGYKYKRYEVADRLEFLFSRGIQVDKNYLNVSSVEANFVTDEVGEMLDFLIYIRYIESVGIAKENYDNMQDININLKL